MDNCTPLPMDQWILLKGIEEIIERWQAEHRRLVSANQGGLNGECLEQIKAEIQNFFNNRNF